MIEPTNQCKFVWIKQHAGLQRDVRHYCQRTEGHTGVHMCLCGTVTMEGDG